MKKIISILLSLMIFSTMLYSCGDSDTTPSQSSTTVSSTQDGTSSSKNDHTHTFETAWTQAEGGHYRVCTCHPDEKVLSPHADSVDRDGKCDVCQFTMKEATGFTFVLKDNEGNPVSGAQVKIYTSSGDSTLITDEFGTVSHNFIYYDSVKAMVLSVPEGYEDISSQIFRFDTTTLEAVTNKIPS